MVLSHLEHLIPEADTRFHNIFASLHFFAKRWGVAGKFLDYWQTTLSNIESWGKENYNESTSNSIQASLLTRLSCF
jgi:hypothetical protein